MTHLGRRIATFLAATAISGTYFYTQASARTQQEIGHNAVPTAETRTRSVDPWGYYRQLLGKGFVQELDGKTYLTTLRWKIPDVQLVSTAESLENGTRFSLIYKMRSDGSISNDANLAYGGGLMIMTAEPDGSIVSHWRVGKDSYRGRSSVNGNSVISISEKLSRGRWKVILRSNSTIVDEGFRGRYLAAAAAAREERQVAKSKTGDSDGILGALLHGLASGSGALASGMGNPLDPDSASNRRFDDVLDAARSQGPGSSRIDGNQSFRRPESTRNQNAGGSSASSVAIKAPDNCSLMDDSASSGVKTNREEAVEGARRMMPSNAQDVAPLACTSVPQITKGLPDLWTCHIPFKRRICTAAARARSE